MRALIDTSSLFKKYVKEPGSAAMDDLLSDCSEIAVSPVTWVELHAVIARRLREKTLSPEQAGWLRSEARKDFQSFYRVLWNEPLEHTTIQLMDRHALSTLDAVQLAAGVLSKADVFVTSDRRLFEAAGHVVRKAQFV